MHVQRLRRMLGVPSVLLLALLPVLIACQYLEVAPTADFKVSPSTNVTLGTMVTLNASESRDPQSFELSYAWTLTPPAASSAHLSASDEAIVTFTPDKVGPYVVLLRVTAKSGSRKSDQKSKTILVTDAGGGMTDAEAVATDKAELQIDYAAGDSASYVTQNLGLPTTGTYGTTIEWQSDHPDIVSAIGVVTPPADTTAVILTATIAKGVESDTRQFTLTVIHAAQVDPVVGSWKLSTVDDTAARTANMAENLVISSDHTWGAIGAFGGDPVDAAGTWAAGGGGTYTVTFQRGGPPEVDQMTLTISAAHDSLSTTVEDRVLKFVPGSVVLPPTGLQVEDASMGAPAIHLSWDASLSPEVTSYVVMRGTSSGEFAKIDTISGSLLEYTDDDEALDWGVTYYYMVTSLAGAEASTIGSNEVSLSVENPVEGGTVVPVIE